MRRTNPKRLATNRPKIKKRKRLEIRSKSGRLIKQPDSDTETYEEEEETRTPVVKVDQEKLMEMECEYSFNPHNFNQAIRTPVSYLLKYIRFVK